MIVRLGYVAMSMVLKDCSPSRTVTVTNLQKIERQEVRISKLLGLARENLHNTRRLLYHNQANDIAVFRITSRLIPLATHPIAAGWHWADDLKDELKSLGELITEQHVRVSAHPDHFTLLNSNREEVIESSIKDLEYHNDIFCGMGLDSSAKLVIHVGGLFGNKAHSADRFIKNFDLLPGYIKGRIVLENDDKIYTAADVLDICQRLGIPMVLDVHHDWCNGDGAGVRDLLAEIFNTWNGHGLVPKVHISSAKDNKNFRSHADYIDPEFFLGFLMMAKKVGKDFDVMIEAKNKDVALFRLMDDIKGTKGIWTLTGASLEI
jgi:UV DNA damage endonuclease